MDKVLVARCKFATQQLIQIVEDFGIALHDDEPVRDVNVGRMPWGRLAWGLPPMGPDGCRRV
jgi:hypothetical protein